MYIGRGDAAIFHFRNCRDLHDLELGSGHGTPSCSTHRSPRYYTIGEFNVDSKAEYSASTRSQKLKQTAVPPFNSVQVKIREVSSEGIRVTMEERDL